jgi:predicted transcriptional regulator
MYLCVCFKKETVMTAVSSKEFVTRRKKYFDLALSEDVCIKRGSNMFHLTHAPVKEQYPEQPVLEPDDDFRRALSTEEFREKLIGVLDKVDKKYVNE